MQIGSFGPVVFEVSNKRVFTASDVKRSSSSNWAAHDRIEGKSRSQYLSPGLKKVTLEVQLRADYGVPPSSTLSQLHRLAEGRDVYPLILGGVPQADNPFKLTACEESDSASLPGGALFSATASLTFEEYT